MLKRGGGNHIDASVEIDGFQFICQHLGAACSQGHFMARVAHGPGFLVYDGGLANYFCSDELPEFVHQTAAMVTDKQMPIWETCLMKGRVRDTMKEFVGEEMFQTWRTCNKYTASQRNRPQKRKRPAGVNDLVK